MNSHWITMWTRIPCSASCGRKAAGWTQRATPKLRENPGPMNLRRVHLRQQWPESCNFSTLLCTPWSCRNIASVPYMTRINRALKVGSTMSISSNFKLAATKRFTIVFNTCMLYGQFEPSPPPNLLFPGFFAFLPDLL